MDSHRSATVMKRSTASSKSATQPVWMYLVRRASARRQKWVYWWRWCEGCCFRTCSKRNIAVLRVESGLLSLHSKTMDSARSTNSENCSSWCSRTYNECPLANHWTAARSHIIIRTTFKSDCTLGWPRAESVMSNKEREFEVNVPTCRGYENTDPELSQFRKPTKSCRWVTSSKT